MEPFPSERSMWSSMFLDPSCVFPFLEAWKEAATYYHQPLPCIPGEPRSDLRNAIRSLVSCARPVSIPLTSACLADCALHFLERPTSSRPSLLFSLHPSMILPSLPLF